MHKDIVPDTELLTDVNSFRDVSEPETFVREEVVTDKLVQQKMPEPVQKKGLSTLDIVLIGVIGVLVAVIVFLIVLK